MAVTYGENAKIKLEIIPTEKPTIIQILRWPFLSIKIPIIGIKIAHIKLGTEVQYPASTYVKPYLLTRNLFIIPLNGKVVAYPNIKRIKRRNPTLEMCFIKFEKFMLFTLFLFASSYRFILNFLAFSYFFDKKIYPNIDISEYKPTNIGIDKGNLKSWDIW